MGSVQVEWEALLCCGHWWMCQVLPYGVDAGGDPLAVPLAWARVVALGVVREQYLGPGTTASVATRAAAKLMLPI